MVSSFSYLFALPLLPVACWICLVISSATNMRLSCLVPTPLAPYELVSLWPIEPSQTPHMQPTYNTNFGTPLSEGVKLVVIVVPLCLFLFALGGVVSVSVSSRARRVAPSSPTCCWRERNECRGSERTSRASQSGPHASSPFCGSSSAYNPTGP